MLIIFLLCFCWLVVAYEGTILVDDGNLSLPGWGLVPGNTSEGVCSGEGYRYSSVESALTFDFQGTNATAYILQARDAAILEVWLDDVFQERIDPFNVTVGDPDLCILYEYQSPVLAWAPHTISFLSLDLNLHQSPHRPIARINKVIFSAPVTPPSPSFSPRGPVSQIHHIGPIVGWGVAYILILILLLIVVWGGLESRRKRSSLGRPIDLVASQEDIENHMSSVRAGEILPSASRIHASPSPPLPGSISPGPKRDPSGDTENPEASKEP